MSLTAMWVTLQFKWVYAQYSQLAILLEKIIFAATPLVATVIQTWGALACVGAANAPFYNLAICTIMYLLFSLPTISSFGIDSGREIIGPTERGVHTLAYLVIPPIFHYVQYRSKLLVGITLLIRHSSTEFWSLVLLGSAPLFVVSMGSRKSSLDFLPFSDDIKEIIASGIPSKAQFRTFPFRSLVCI